MATTDSSAPAHPSTEEKLAKLEERLRHELMDDEERLEDDLRHADLGIEERCELADRVLRLRRRLAH
jgi:hypothetical protein